MLWVDFNYWTFFRNEMSFSRVLGGFFDTARHTTLPCIFFFSFCVSLIGMPKSRSNCVHLMPSQQNKRNHLDILEGGGGGERGRCCHNMFTTGIEGNSCGTNHPQTKWNESISRWIRFDFSRWSHYQSGIWRCARCQVYGVGDQQLGFRRGAASFWCAHTHKHLTTCIN